MITILSIFAFVLVLIVMAFVCIVKYKRNMDNRMKSFESRIEKQVQTVSLVECAKCGCLLWKDSATNIRGKPEIRQKRGQSYYGGCYTEDYIYYPWYCKRCAPKEKEK